MNKITSRQFFWRIVQEGAMGMDVAVHDKILGWNVDRAWARLARQLFQERKKYTFSYENDRGRGMYVHADTEEEADLLFLERCKTAGTESTDFQLVRVQKGGVDGPWVWDLYSGLAFPDL